MENAVIVDVVRTASGRGKPGGALSEIHPVELLAATLKALVTRNDIDPAIVDDVIAGCVSQAGEQTANIARNAVLSAGYPESVPGTTVDRQCGSSQQAMHFAAQGVIAGAYDVVVACGVESMSRVPMRFASVGRDPSGPGMRARYPEGLANQGVGAELIAAKWKLTREELDEFSARSHQRAAATAAAGGFDNEIIPFEAVAPDGSTFTHTVDQTVRPSTTAEGLAGLKPSFYTEQYAERFPQIGWHITPGNSSPLSDGASAALIMSESKASALGLRPRARFHSFALAGDDPLYMLTAPLPATQKILRRSDLSLDDIDAYEVNEAFASVPLFWAKELGADPAKLNPRGGAIALGHPLGGSGVKLMATMLNYLEATGGRYGLQTMCEGGGMANATIIERL
ncbi:acetyl-CoA acyltransferase [Parafrankia irregularis]|uniref:Acetyl-CoA acyltransferase n=1 Tax=Parafrankia irregularis TaxID=795642 RepID=A0A0S4QLG1_9ACTN|nr:MULTISPECIES: acetyl-CoA C-acyltransferase [Parafrankia]MBE3202165.1 acetyl-CoA C-acyltransferase [Parafrankia sp. CH37]CUU55950.1 acetyl-CoA acyltransferase [Parafrankia irregularis]